MVIDKEKNARIFSLQFPRIRITGENNTAQTNASDGLQYAGGVNGTVSAKLVFALGY